MACCERGDRGLAHERHVEAIVGAQAIVEIGAHLLAARLLLGRDRAAIGEAAIGVEGVLGKRLRSAGPRQQQRAGRQNLCGKPRRGAPSCRTCRRSFSRKLPSLRPQRRALGPGFGVKKWTNSVGARNRQCRHFSPFERAWVSRATRQRPRRSSNRSMNGACPGWIFSRASAGVNHCGAIDFGEGLHLPAVRRPFQLEPIRLERRRIEIAVDREGGDRSCRSAARSRRD